MQKLNCEEVRGELMLYTYGEIEGEREEAIEQHLVDCPGCREELTQIQAMLSQVDTVSAEPSAELLSRCRMDLRAALTPETKPEPVWKRWWSAVLHPTGAMRPAMASAMAVVLLGAGFLGGKAFEQKQTHSTNAQEVGRVRAIQGLGDGNVRIIFDEARERVVSGDLQDEAVQRLLLAATQQATDPGLRMESVDLLRNRCNRDDVRRAVMQTLERDSDPSVRLRALEALRPYTQESDVRRAVSSVLLQDANPNVRVLAIDVLIDQAPGEMVGTLQQVMRKEENDYVRARVIRALSAMRASPGVF
jgi:hypothetical protein